MVRRRGGWIPACGTFQKPTLVPTEDRGNEKKLTTGNAKSSESPGEQTVLPRKGCTGVR